MNHMGIFRYFSIISIIFLTFSAHAEELSGELHDTEDKVEAKKLERITVVGTGENINKVPGSTWLIKGKNLEEVKGGVDDIHNVLRRVPGVNIIQEDGYGLRPNIGLRGVPSERSANITLMEDGVLIAPAPYAAPEAYYFPPTGRMEGIEITKGSSQLKYGPRTTGGALNMLSTSIPKKFSLNFNGRFGQDDTLNGHFNIGDSYKHGGFLLETYQAQTDGFKQLDGGGDTGFDLQDYIGKFKINTDKNEEYYQELEVKLGKYNQDSDETYLGITKEDFNRNPYRRYRGSMLDNMKVDHEQIHVRHFGELGDNTDITNLFYINKLARKWSRLATVNDASITGILDDPATYADEFGWITGADSPDDAFSIRNNRRSYSSRGFQSILGTDLVNGNVKQELELSVRYHYDYEDRFQEDDFYNMRGGSLNLNRLGIPGSQANRKGEADALAFYVQDKISIDKLTVTPILRYEDINFKRADWGSNDQFRDGTSLSTNYTRSSEVIPGIGAHYALNDEWGVFGGVNKGFAPSGPQSSDDVDEEKSINYETGLNFNSKGFNSELVLFYNDYSNLLGADSASSGGSGSGDLFNAGRSEVYGLEASFDYDISKAVDTSYKLPVYATYTFTDAEFRENFNSPLFGLVSAGDSIPYIATHNFSSGIAIDHDLFRVGLDMFYQDSMPTVAGAASVKAANQTDSHAVFNLETAYKVSKNNQIYLSVINLFDNEYVVAARPAGVRPGMPQTLFLGIRIKL